MENPKLKIVKVEELIIECEQCDKETRSPVLHIEGWLLCKACFHIKIRQDEIELYKEEFT